MISQPLVHGHLTWLKSSCVPSSLSDLWKKDVTDDFSFGLCSHSWWWKASTEIFQFYFKCNDLKILGEGKLPVLNLVPSTLRHINIICVWYQDTVDLDYFMHIFLLIFAEGFSVGTPVHLSSPDNAIVLRKKEKILHFLQWIFFF